MRLRLQTVLYFNTLTRMKSVAVFCLLVVTLALAEAARHEKYTTKYDNINIEDILNSDRLLQNYINCLLEKGRCTPDGVELKKNLPDALHTECSKCSEKQKAGAEKVIKYLIDHKPGQWRQLEEKYDPDGFYRKKYEEHEKRLLGRH